MKVLMLNGSAREKGCTFTALSEVAKELKTQGVDTEIVYAGAGLMRDCTECQKCKDGHCVFNDDMINGFIDKARESDGFIFGSPTYYAHPSGRILSILDRAFYAGAGAFTRKPGAAVISARRAGTVAALDVLNKYFTINRMPVVSSRYWNMVHGNTPAEVMQDKEGMQVMRYLGREMAYMLKAIAAAKKTGVPLPEEEPRERTNFIR